MTLGKRLILGAVVLTAVVFLILRQVRRGEPERPGQPASGAVRPTGKTVERAAKPVRGATGRMDLSAAAAAERMAQVEKIRRDYDEIRGKASADFAAAGGRFPGGVSAFLRQLALLEREMYADIAKVLPPRELEDYEMRETTTGKALEQNLAGITVPEETKRAVFRLRREFDERFALVFDMTPVALFERESLRQVLVGEMRGLVDEATFGALVRVEDPSFAGLRALVAQQGQSPQVAEDLWRMKNDYILRKLEIQAQPGLAAEQRTAMQAALSAQIRSNVAALTGPDALRAGGDALGWVPLSK